MAGFTRLGHQSYLQVATETGLPGLVAFLALWALLIRALLRRLRVPEVERWVPCAALAALAGFLVHNLVDYTWYCPAIAASLFLLLGAGCAAQVAFDRGASPGVPRCRRAGALVGLGLLTVVLSVFLAAQTRQIESSNAYSAGDLNGAVQAARGALAVDPWDAESWDALAVARYPLPPALGRGLADLQEAIDARMQEARVRPTDPTTWRRLALLYGERRDYGTALECLGRALDLNPNYVLAWADRARLAGLAGRPDLVASSWQRVAALYDTPVRRFAALEYPDATYLYAFDYLAQQAERQGDGAAALDYRRKLVPMLTGILALPQLQLMMMQNILLLQPGDLDNLRLMAYHTVDALRATGNPADANLAGQLDQALSK